MLKQCLQRVESLQHKLTYTVLSRTPTKCSTLSSPCREFIKSETRNISESNDPSSAEDSVKHLDMTHLLCGSSRNNSTCLSTRDSMYEVCATRFFSVTLVLVSTISASLHLRVLYNKKNRQLYKKNNLVEIIS